MDDYVSESDSDYTSYWRDWVSATSDLRTKILPGPFVRCPGGWGRLWRYKTLAIP